MKFVIYWRFKLDVLIYAFVYSNNASTFSHTAHRQLSHYFMLMIFEKFLLLDVKKSLYYIYLYCIGNYHIYTILYMYTFLWRKPQCCEMWLKANGWTIYAAACVYAFTVGVLAISVFSSPITYIRIHIYLIMCMM